MSMEKNKTIHIVVLIAVLLVGVYIGYGLSANKEEGYIGMHRMENGEMMEGTGSAKNMQDTMISMSASLQGKSGDEFDKAFLSQMIMHHEGAVIMANAALINAKHTEIKELAKNIIAAQTSEITQMKGWLTSWYPAR